MRLSGVLLIIWGGLLVPLTLPWTWGYRKQLGLIASLDEMTMSFLGDRLSYAYVVSFSVILVGLGLSWIAFATVWDPPYPRARGVSEKEQAPPSTTPRKSSLEEVMGDRPIDPMRLH
ncbi:hypothetical protein D9623_09425 [Azospirillum brasilense]|uniref:Uncharacterized protein n=1 Tax=Azospirillum brasilense TaxID=192 RepID=A0A0P0F6R1_AZOBR|nr:MULTISPECIES: hypothetical protein [Azospirillum]ALJ35551.1 hypothetical protein AMK58_09015 [Azospirillum brasilense]MDW7555585.1 hypothetical protein [Azospirillum brasilense]MDW7595512.1 hypothetical protein [Azospirillum brasilense]MDW7630517.1 hypothetical protein [Azospirillum brasilense]MDX5954287.1 hypothetical protein [Azospirillum brasilense]